MAQQLGRGIRDRKVQCTADALPSNNFGQVVHTYLSV